MGVLDDLEAAVAALGHAVGAIEAESEFCTRPDPCMTCEATESDADAVELVEQNLPDLLAVCRAAVAYREAYDLSLGREALSVARDALIAATEGLT